MTLFLFNSYVKYFVYHKSKKISNLNLFLNYKEQTPLVQIPNTKNNEHYPPSSIVGKTKTKRPFNEPVIQMTKFTLIPKELATRPIVETKNKWSKPIVSAVKCCEEKGILKSCVRHCVVEIEKSRVTIDTSACSKSISIISQCIGEEIKRMSISGDILGK